MYESAMHRWNCIRKHLVQQYWHYFINFHVYGLMTLVCLPGLVWLALTASSRTYELVRKFVLATWKNLVEIQGRKVQWYSFILARTQNHLVFHLNWPELTVHALFIIISDVFYWKKSDNYVWTYCISKILWYKLMCCHKKVVNVSSCSFNYCIPISIFKAIGQLLMGVLHFKDWWTLSCGCNCCCSSARRLSKFNSKEPQS